jgi:hypothetical protein
VTRERSKTNVIAEKKLTNVLAYSLSSVQRMIISEDNTGGRRLKEALGPENPSAFGRGTVHSTCPRGVPDLENNNKCCSMNENVSKRRVVPTAPHPAVQPSCLPLSQQHAHSKVRGKSSYGPKTAVTSFHPRSLEESRQRVLVMSSCAKTTKFVVL